MGWEGWTAVWSLRANHGITYVALDDYCRASGIVAGFTTRLGGVSEAPYASLNLALHVGDDAGRVLENRGRLAAATAIDVESMVFADQIHGNRIEIVDSRDRGRGALCRESAVAETDGLITSSRGTMVLVMVADCVPVLLLAPSVPAVAVVHAGWRGTAARIVPSAVALMAAAYGLSPSEIRAGIGPAIGSCCYEVSTEVADRVRLAAEPASKYHRRVSNGAASERSRLDLQAENREQLLQSGIPPDSISVVRICTACHTDLFYSHRAEGGVTGRFAAFAYIDPAGYNRTGEGVTGNGIAL